MTRGRERPGPAAAGPPSDAAEVLRRELADLWHEFRPINVERVAVIEVLLTGPTIDDVAARDRARREAHKLVGSLGTFGFHHESEVARAVELLLLQPLDGVRDRDELRSLLADLRAGLDRDIGTGVPVRATLRTVGIAAETLDALVEGGRGRGVEVAAVASDAVEADPTSADDDLVFLLALPVGAAAAAVLATVRRLSERVPAVPVLVLAADDSLATRLTVAHHGATAFLAASASVDQIFEAALQALQHDGAIEATILAVDDDPSILGALRALLAPRATRLHTLSDPARFWETLEATKPDLLILDIDMPGVSGIDLCRVVRGDPRWLRTPVLFLTARSDAATLNAVFSAGADDYVHKPIVGPELLTRITNRLDRTYLMRQLAETDALTGVANRRKSVDTLQHLIQLAGRQSQPLTLAIIDLDHFKQVNDRYGHAVGDAVLARLGQVLLRSFRGEDVVARWGGEEFVVGMYGMSAVRAVRRLGDVLAGFRRERFDDERGGEIGVTFSAGVAEFVVDADDLQRLYRAADAALYRAKAEGRNRIAAASVPASPA